MPHFSVTLIKGLLPIFLAFEFGLGRLLEDIWKLVSIFPITLKKIGFGIRPAIFFLNGSLKIFF